MACQSSSIDGGHVPKDQVDAFNFLFSRALRPGGVYALLDVETSYWDAPGAELYGRPIAAGRGKPGSAVETFKQLADGVNREFFQPCWDTGALGASNPFWRPCVVPPK
jgi:hypothetical protein